MSLGNNQLTIHPQGVQDRDPHAPVNFKAIQTQLRTGDVPLKALGT